MYTNLKNQTIKVINEIIEKANLKKGNILVIGCSTSEILNSKIGTNSAPDVANAVFDGLYSVSQKKGICLAFQCCEHLNRAIVIERKYAINLEEVNVIPQPKAGGSMATCAYEQFNDPIIVESIKADAGLDIGLTLIGMHLKNVAVPVRLENNKIGEALVVGARTRPKFIGGIRAVYNQNKL